MQGMANPAFSASYFWVIMIIVSTLAAAMNVTSIQREGMTLSDMAKAMPGLTNLTGTILELYDGMR